MKLVAMFYKYSILIKFLPLIKLLQSKSWLKVALILSVNLLYNCKYSVLKGKKIDIIVKLH